MTGLELKAARITSSWTQNDAAKKLGITQAYLSMVERGIRPISSDVAARDFHFLDISATALPLRQYHQCQRDVEFFQRALGTLGYPGFAYMRRNPKLNPAEVLMEALDSENLDSRVTEALPWLAATYPTMDWTWLTFNAKVRDRQNRLAFITLLSSQIAGKQGDSAVEDALLKIVNMLERSRLAAEDTLCKTSMKAAEGKWLRMNRPSTARHWNLLTDLCVESSSNEPL